MKTKELIRKILINRDLQIRRAAVLVRRGNDFFFPVLNVPQKEEITCNSGEIIRIGPAVERR